MNEPLESNLRTALRERASLVPGASVDRLTGHDYHPRHSRLRPPVAIGATATAAAAAGAATLVISLGAGATNAFAGWTAKPTQPAPGQIEAAQTSCESGQSPVSGLPLKLADTRGPFTFSVYANSQSSASCIKGPSFTAVTTNTSSVPVSVPDGQIVLSIAQGRAAQGGALGGGGPGLGGGGPARAAGAPYSFAEGRTGSGVTGVTLVLDDGTTVQATVGNGWFVAWWPGDQRAKSAQLTTPSGVKTQALNTGPRVPPGHGSGSVSATAGGSVSTGGSGPSGPPAGTPSGSASSSTFGSSISGSSGGPATQSDSTSR
jgi:hypothetical protein